MQLHQVKPTHRQRNKKRVGRGGKRGTYSGKGIKGQKSRAGHKIRPEIRDFIKKIPKRRGYRFKPIKSKPEIVNLRDLEKHFNEGDLVNPETLLEKRLISRIKGSTPEVKILGTGELKKKLKIENCKMSESARKVLGIKKLEKKKTETVVQPPSGESLVR
jgi:large subunit ribosomal protein L15